MYNRQHYYYPPDDMYYTSDPSYMQQPFNSNPPVYGNAPNQTPFEYFAKPAQPEDWSYNMQQPNPSNYSSQQMNAPPNNVMGYFQNENGQMDFDKMLSTVGQIANTYHQVSPIVKQVGALIKTFRT